MVDRFRVGIITGTHGLGGEVKVLPTTDDPQRFKDLKSVYLTGGRDEKKLTVSSVKFAGRFVIVGFAEYGSIEDVEKLRGTNIEIDRKDAVKLKEGQYFIPDIIGLNVDPTTPINILPKVVAKAVILSIFNFSNTVTINGTKINN